MVQLMHSHTSSTLCYEILCYEMTTALELKAKSAL
jgi:hypothetical protein